MMIGSEALAREIATFPFVGIETTSMRIDYTAWDKAGMPSNIDDFKKPYTAFHLDLDALPEGWTLAGQGCSRTVFRGPDGVCYKIMNDKIGGDLYGQGLDLSQNFYEAMAFTEKAESVRSISNGRARLAALSYYYDLDVVAMEYSKRTGECRDWSAFVSAGFGRDLHDGNMWRDAHGDVLIDYAV